MASTYKICSGSTPSELDTLVQTYLDDGFFLHGSMAVASSTDTKDKQAVVYTQAVTKKNQ